MATILARHAAETDLLARALSGDRDAVEGLLGRLGSANGRLCRMMLETVSRCIDLRLWQRLLRSMALHRWDENEDCRSRTAGAVSHRIDAAIADLFVDNDVSEVVPVKLAVLLQGLSDPDCRVRSAAATLLGLRGDSRGLDALTEAVRRGEPQHRLRAIAALGKLRDERSGWVLIEALASDHEKVHHEAGRALCELGECAVPALTDALRHPQQHVRWHAVRALADIGGVRSAAALVDALADDDFGVRWAAAEALAAIGEPAVPAILERLAHPALADQVRQVVYHALHQIPSRRVQARLRPLLDALRSPAAATGVPEVSQQLLRNWDSPRRRPVRSLPERRSRKDEVTHE